MFLYSSQLAMSWSKNGLAIGYRAARDVGTCGNGLPI